MAKELEKFQAEYKKLQAGIKKYAVAEGEKIKKRIGISLGNAWEGEDYFRESLAKARENGVTSEKLADFQKDKNFKDGLAAWQKAAEMHQGEVDAMTAFCNEAGALHAKLAKLLADIGKDLKKRAKTSASKKDIEALQATLAKEAAEVKKASDYIGKLNAAQKMYAANFDKAFARIMKEGPETHAKKKDATQLPQLLQDRNRKKSANQVAALSKAITALCSSAIDKAGEDLRAAVPDLKQAAARFKDLKKINDSYQLVKKKFPGAIKASKDSKAILKLITTFDTVYTDAERKIRGATVTIKKAAG